jgi:hypothetical protein
MRQIQFVYLYINGPDNGLELQLSIRSVERNFKGKAKITVVGTKPSWYTGHFIDVPPFKGIREAITRRPFRDTQNKIMQCLHHPEIDEKFVWIMDDVYLLKPTTLAELSVPRFDPWYRVNNKTVWHQQIRITFAALAKNGKSNLQYGTHLPHVFEKKNLIDCFGQYDYPKQLLLFEILHGNHVNNPDIALPYTGFLRRFLKPVSWQQLDAVQENVLNYQSRVWNSTMREWLRDKFPEE